MPVPRAITGPRREPLPTGPYVADGGGLEAMDSGHVAGVPLGEDPTTRTQHALGYTTHTMPRVEPYPWSTAVVDDPDGIAGEPLRAMVGLFPVPDGVIHPVTPNRPTIGSVSLQRYQPTRWLPEVSHPFNAYGHPPYSEEYDHAQKLGMRIRPPLVPISYDDGRIDTQAVLDEEEDRRLRAANALGY